MKKVLTIIFASAFALTLAAPIAAACPGSDGVMAKDKKEKKQEKEQVVKEDAKKEKKSKAKKKPVKVSKK